jgi:hypothetical protein
MGIAVAMLAVSAFVGARQLLGASELRRIGVVAGGGGLQCDGTTVAVQDVDFLGAKMPVLAADIRQEMHCRYRFLVVNDGSRAVKLTHVSIAFLGPLGRTAVKAVSLSPTGALPAPNQVGAHFNLNMSLAPHSATALTLPFDYRPEGCTASGGWMSWRNQPIVTVRARGVIRRPSLRGLSFAIKGNDFSNSGPGCK